VDPRDLRLEVLVTDFAAAGLPIDLRAHDERAAQWFQPENFPGGLPDEVYNKDPHGDGRWRIAYKDGRPVGGVFWTPATGAHVGYGPIFARYVRPAPADDYPDPREDDEPVGDHAHDFGVDDLDISAIAWGKAIE
jgi:hypothetical protein